MNNRVFGIPTTMPDRCLVMGIVNVTQDSFSDGGKYLHIDKAIEHAHELIAQGADLIDVGGESTRPGATRVSEEEELARVVPVIEALAAEGIVTSVDTMRASVAAAAAQAGVRMLNDVSGGLADPNMYPVMAESDIPVCLMHWKTVRFGDAAGRSDFTDVVGDVKQSLARLVDNALAAGVRPENITIDPGLGFAKSAEDNWALLNALPDFVAGEYPVLVGASRKRFLAALRPERGYSAPGYDPDDIAANTDPATAAVTTLSASAGAWCVRVHDVAQSRDAVDVVAHWKRGQ